MTEYALPEPRWEVWIVLHGGILHLASRTEPKMRVGLGDIHSYVAADWVPGPHGVIGDIDWAKVDAVSWRRSDELS